MSLRHLFPPSAALWAIPLLLWFTPALAIAETGESLTPLDSGPVGTFLGVVGPATPGAWSADQQEKIRTAEKELVTLLTEPPLVFESPAVLAQRTHLADVRARVLEQTDEQWPAKIRENAAIWKYPFLLTVRYAHAESGEWLYTASLFRREGDRVKEVTEPDLYRLVTDLKSLMVTTPVTQWQPCGDQARVSCENPLQALVGAPLEIRCRVDPPSAVKLDLRVQTPGSPEFAASPLPPDADGTVVFHVSTTREGYVIGQVLGFGPNADPENAPALCRLTYQPIRVSPAPKEPPPETPVTGDVAALPRPDNLIPPEPPRPAANQWPAAWNKLQCPEDHQQCRSTRVEPFSPGDYCLDDLDDQNVRLDVRRIYNDLRSAVSIFDKDGNLIGVRRAALVVTGYASLGEHDHTSQELERYACHPLPPESGLLPVDNIYLLDPDRDARLAFFRGESLYMSLLLLSALDVPSPFRAWFPHVMSTHFITSKGGLKDAEREPDPLAGHAEVTGKVVGLTGAGNTRSTVSLLLFDEPQAPPPATTPPGRATASSDSAGINVLNVKVSVDSPPPVPVAALEPAPRQVPEGHWMQWVGASIGTSGLALLLTGSIIAGNGAITNNNALYETGQNDQLALTRTYDGYAVLGTGLIMTVVGGAMVVSDLLERRTPPTTSRFLW